MAAQTSPAVVTVSVACESDRCRRCRGQVVSLTVPAGTRCSHGCHQREGATMVQVVWRALPDGQEHRQAFYGPGRYADADRLCWELRRSSRTYHVHVETGASS